MASRWLTLIAPQLVFVTYYIMYWLFLKWTSQRFFFGKACHEPLRPFGPFASLEVKGDKHEFITKRGLQSLHRGGIDI